MKTKYAIIVTNTWTEKEQVFPCIFNIKSNAEEKVLELEGKCSVTKNIKNNHYQIVEISYTVTE